LVAIIFVFVSFLLLGCQSKNSYNYFEDTLLWTNENSILVSIEGAEATKIMRNVDNAFPKLQLAGTYVHEKCFTDSIQVLVLRLVLKIGGQQSLDNALAILRNDHRVDYAYVLNDVPHDTINTLQIIPSNTEVHVGDIIELTVDGTFSLYLPSFMFDKIHISFYSGYKHKTYTPADFSYCDIKSVNRWDLSYITYFELELEHPSYFGVCKTLNAIARDRRINTAWLDGLLYPEPSAVTMPYWDTTDATVIDFVDKTPNHWDAAGNVLGYEVIPNTEGKVLVKALKVGTASISYMPPMGYGRASGVSASLEITVL
jgi:hypothetical protein